MFVALGSGCLCLLTVVCFVFRKYGLLVLRFVVCVCTVVGLLLGFGNGWRRLLCSGFCSGGR